MLGGQIGVDRWAVHASTARDVAARAVDYKNCPVFPVARRCPPWQTADGDARPEPVQKIAGKAPRLTVPSGFIASPVIRFVSGTCLTSTTQLYDTYYLLIGNSIHTGLLKVQASLFKMACKSTKKPLHPKHDQIDN